MKPQQQQLSSEQMQGASSRGSPKPDVPVDGPDRSKPNPEPRNSISVFGVKYPAWLVIGATLLTILFAVFGLVYGANRTETVVEPSADDVVLPVEDPSAQPVADDLPPAAVEAPAAVDEPAPTDPATDVASSAGSERDDAVENDRPDEVEEPGDVANPQDTVATVPAPAASVVADPTSDAAPDAETGAFSGTISSDNGWFVITVTADGEAAGTLTVSFAVDGGEVYQTGTFAGAIGADNIVSCFGTYNGISTDEKGRQFPHSGTVEVRAVPKPTASDPTAWEITADGEPGDVVVLPAHAS